MGVLERIKETASRKKADFDRGVEKEKRYTAYKHPDADYIVHGQRPYGPKTKEQSEEADAFAERKAGEEAKAAERKERSREKKERIKAAIKEKAVRAGGKLVGAAGKFGKQMIEDTMRKPGGSSVFGTDVPPREQYAPPQYQGQPAPQRPALIRASGVDPLGGMGRGIDVFGGGSMRGFDPIGAGKPINPLGSGRAPKFDFGFGGKKGKKRKFSLF